MANFFSKIGSWVSDRLGLKAPKVTMPTIDQNKAAITDDIAGWARDLIGKYKTFKGYGEGPGGIPQHFAFRPYFQQKAVDPAVQKALAQLPGQGNAGTNAYVQGGGFLTSGGYDPTMKALSYEQATRGMDAMRDDDLRAVTEMFGRRGLANSSAAMGKAGRVAGDYADRKANIIGQILLEDMNKAEQYRTADLDKLDNLDTKNYKVMQDILAMAQAAASGSPYTPTSMAEYESSLAKRGAWDDKWSKIIGAVGDYATARYGK